MADGQIKIEIGASMDGLQSAINKAKKNLQDLAKDADKDSASISKAMDGAVKDIKKSFDGLSDVDLSKIKEELQASVTEGENTAKSFDDVKTSGQNLEAQQTSLRARLKEIQQAMADLQLAGKQDSAEFQEMAIEAGRLRDAIGDAQTRISALANDNQGIQALSSTMSGLAGAGSAATGAVALLGDESDDLQKVMVKLQSVMAITNGLQAVANTLNKDSATSIYAQVNGSKLLNTIKASAYPVQQAENKAIEENTIATKANNVAKGQGVTSTVASTTATTANTTATTVATTAQFSLAGAIKGVGLAIKTALGPFGLIAMAIGGVVAIIMKLTSESRKAEKEMEEMRKATAEFAAAPISQLDALRAEFADTKDQEKWFNDNKARIQELAPEIQKLTEAQELFNKTAEFNSAKTAEGYLQQMEKKAEEAKKKLLEIPQAEIDAYNRALEKADLLRSQGYEDRAQNVETWANGSNAGVATKEDEKAQQNLLNARKAYNQAMNALGLQDIANRRAENAKMVSAIKEGMDAEINAFDAQIKNMSGRQAEEAKLQSEHNKTLISLWAQRQDLLKRQDEGENVDSLLASLDKQEQAELQWFDSERKAIQAKYTDVIDQTLSEYDRRMAQAKKDYESATADLNKQASQDSYSSENESYYTNKQIELDRDYAKQRADIMRDESSQEIALWKETEEAKVAQMTDTTQKQLAEYKLAHDERMKQIEAETLALQEQNKGDASLTLVGDSGMTQEQLDEQNAKKIKADEEYKNSLMSTLSDIDKDYGDFTAKLLARKKETNAKMEALTTAESVGAMTKEEMDKYIAGIAQSNTDWLTQTAQEVSEQELGFGASAESILENAITNIDSAIVEMQAELEQLKKTDPTNPRIKELEAEIVDASRASAELKQRLADMRNANKKAGWDEMCQSIDKVGSELKSLGNSIGGVAGDIVSIAGECLTTASTVITAITTLSTGSMTAMEGTAIAASTAIQMVEKASVILAVISAAMQVVQGIISLFSSEKESIDDLVDEYEAYADAINDCIDRKKELASTQVGDDLLSTMSELDNYYRQLEESSRSILKTMFTTRDKGKHSTNYYVKNKMDDTAWGQLAENFGMSVADTKTLVGGGGFDKIYELSVEELEIIRDTPSVWKNFDDSTQEAINNIIDAESGLKSETELMVESVTGLSFEDLADNFKDTFQDMEATAEDFTQNFKDIMWEAISNVALGTSGYNDWLEDWQTRLATATNAGDDKELERLYQEAVDKAQELDDQQNELLEKYSYLQEDLEDDASTLSGALSSASQESIDLLAGQTNACRINQLTEIDVMREAMESTTALINQQNAIQNNALGALQDAVDELILIRVATQTCADYSETMNRALNSIDGSCSEMASGYDFRAYGNVS